MDEDKIKAAVLDAFEVSLEAQLRAVRRLKEGKAEPRRIRKGMSQVDMAYDILRRAEGPLHISEILDRIARFHSQRLDRESLASALVKKVQRRDRFTRTDPNVFALLKGGQ
jgi:hypothetical protein